MSIFTRRNYVWLASVARDMILTSQNAPNTNDQIKTGVRIAINELANALEAESPSFDKQQFFDTVYKDPTIDPQL